VDILTHFAAHFASRRGVPTSRVIGSGTMLDTARFRALLGRHHGVDPQHVHAYVIGEHGDSEVLTWSQATIAGMPLDEFCGTLRRALSAEERAQIEDKVRRAAYHIIEGKGSTYYGIGSAVARLLEALLQNQRAILTISSRQTNVPGLENITISLPHIISGEGVVAAIPLTLDAEERKALSRSAALLRDTIDELKLP
jgi:L-lactate dehydrogenase